MGLLSSVDSLSRILGLFVVSFIYTNYGMYLTAGLMSQYCRCPAWRTSIMSREAGHNAVLHAGHRQYWHCWIGAASSPKEGTLRPEGPHQPPWRPLELATIKLIFPGNHINCYIFLWNHSSDAGTVGARGANGPPPIFCISVNPIQPGKGKLSPPITTGTTNVFHLPASLLTVCIY